MMCTVANLAFEAKEDRVDRIINDKGLDLIVDSLEYHTRIRDTDTSEICIDALSHLSRHPRSLPYLGGTNVMEAIVDLLRQQVNDRLCYKSLRALTGLCANNALSARFMDKGGYKVAVNIVPTYRNDLKCVYQSARLMNVLLDKYPARDDDFVFAGVIDEIVPVYETEWP